MGQPSFVRDSAGVRVRVGDGGSETEHCYYVNLHLARKNIPLCPILVRITPVQSQEELESCF